MKGSIVGALAIVVLGLGTVALADEKAAKPHPGFEKLKQLAGEWVMMKPETAGEAKEGAAGAKGEPKDAKKEGQGAKREGQEAKAPTASGGKGDEKSPDKNEQVAIVYRVIAAGSALQEHMFPGTDHEMVTMYHLDGEDLRLTHYCAVGNQPRMKAEKSDAPDKLVFKFDGGTNLDPAKDGHMHELTITFIDDDHIRQEWTYYKDGKAGQAETFDLVRKTARG